MASPTVNIDSTISKLFNKIDDITQFILVNNSKVTESLNTAKHYLCSEIKQLYVKMNQIETEVTVLQDRIDCLERDKVNNDIVISGVPFVENTSVYDIVMNICNAIAIPDGSTIVNDVFWINHRNSRKSKTPTIVVKFINWHAKTRFFKNYIKLNNLNLTHIGLRGTSRIYCNDGLTKTNSVIFNNAKSYQKRNVISKVMSKKGQIFIVLLNQSASLLIKSVNQLNDVIADSQCTILDQQKLTSASRLCNSIDEAIVSTIPPVLVTSPALITSASTSSNNAVNEHHQTTKKGNNTMPQVYVDNNEKTFVPTTEPVLRSSIISMTSKMDECINKLIEDCNSPVSSLSPPSKRNLRSKVYRTNSVTK